MNIASAIMAGASSAHCEELAAVLFALDFECLSFGQHFAGDLPRDGIEAWWFAESSRCGRWTQAQVIAAWNDEAWLLGQQSSPLAYAITSVKNLRAIREELAEKVPAFVCRAHGRTVILRKDATAELLRKAERWVG